MSASFPIARTGKIDFVVRRHLVGLHLSSGGLIGPVQQLQEHKGPENFHTYVEYAA